MTDSDHRTGLDRWMAEHPWHPRLLPLFVYVLFLMAIGAATDWNPRIYPLLYAVQCVVVSALLWRYRSLLPELNFRFHWLALPAAVAGAAAWIGLGRAMMHLWPQHFAPATPPTSFMNDMGPAVGWTAMSLRLLGMSLLVPVVEELFYRSALLRSLYHPRSLLLSIVDLLQDLPGIGERIARSRLGREVNASPRPLARGFEQTRLGQVSVFGLIASTALWCLLSHQMRDWPGTVACGMLYVGVLWATQRGRTLGLGPVIWAHGLTNALLWAYTLWQDDWSFL